MSTFNFQSSFIKITQKLQDNMTVHKVFVLPLGVCCSNLKENNALMKMGLALVLVGHVNFLLGALVHGAVLRYIVVKIRIRTLVYAVSNILAIVAGLMVS